MASTSEDFAKESLLYQYQCLINLIANDMRYVQALDQVTPVARQDDISAALLPICNLTHQYSPYIAAFLPLEFKRNLSDPGSIMRASSMVAKLASQCAKEIGSSFLKDQFAPIIAPIASNTTMSFELDADKLPRGVVEDILPLNEARLLQATFSVMDTITSPASLSKIPEEIRAIATLIYNTAVEFNLDPWPLVGGFIILRFINPCIVSPNSYGITTTAPAGNARRNLVLVSKVIQSASNGIAFGEKEPYMMVMNSFVEGAIPQITAFLQNCASIDPASCCVLRPVNVSLETIGVKPALYIHDLIAKDVEAYLAAAAASRPFGVVVNEETEARMKERDSELRGLVTSLGAVPRRQEIFSLGATNPRPVRGLATFGRVIQIVDSGGMTYVLTENGAIVRWPDPHHLSLLTEGLTRSPSFRRRSPAQDAADMAALNLALGEAGAQAQSPKLRSRPDQLQATKKETAEGGTVPEMSLTTPPSSKRWSTISGEHLTRAQQLIEDDDKSPGQHSGVSVEVSPDSREGRGRSLSLRRNRRVSLSESPRMAPSMDPPLPVEIEITPSDDDAGKLRSSVTVSNPLRQHVQLSGKAGHRRSVSTNVAYSILADMVAEQQREGSGLVKASSLERIGEVVDLKPMVHSSASGVSVGSWGKVTVQRSSPQRSRTDSDELRRMRAHSIQSGSTISQSVDVSIEKQKSPGSFLLAPGEGSPTSRARSVSNVDEMSLLKVAVETRQRSVSAQDEELMQSGSTSDGRLSPSIEVHTPSHSVKQRPHTTGGSSLPLVSPSYITVIDADTIKQKVEPPPSAAPPLPAFPPKPDPFKRSKLRSSNLFSTHTKVNPLKMGRKGSDEASFASVASSNSGQTSAPSTPSGGQSRRSSLQCGKISIHVLDARTDKPLDAYICLRLGQQEVQLRRLHTGLVRRRTDAPVFDAVVDWEVTLQMGEVTLDMEIWTKHLLHKDEMVACGHLTLSAKNCLRKWDAITLPLESAVVHMRVKFEPEHSPSPVHMQVYDTSSSEPPSIVQDLAVSIPPTRSDSPKAVSPRPTSAGFEDPRNPAALSASLSADTLRAKYGHRRAISDLPPAMNEYAPPMKDIAPQAVVVNPLKSRTPSPVSNHSMEAFSNMASRRLSGSSETSQDRKTTIVLTPQRRFSIMESAPEVVSEYVNYSPKLEERNLTIGTESSAFSPLAVPLPIILPSQSLSPVRINSSPILAITVNDLSLEVPASAEQEKVVVDHPPARLSPSFSLPHIPTPQTEFSPPSAFPVFVPVTDPARSRSHSEQPSVQPVVTVNSSVVSHSESTGASLLSQHSSLPAVAKPLPQSPPLPPKDRSASVLSAASVLTSAKESGSKDTKETLTGPSETAPLSSTATVSPQSAFSALVKHSVLSAVKSASNLLTAVQDVVSPNRYSVTAPDLSQAALPALDELPLPPSMIDAKNKSPPLPPKPAAKFRHAATVPDNIKATSPTTSPVTPMSPVLSSIRSQKTLALTDFKGRDAPTMMQTRLKTATTNEAESKLQIEAELVMIPKKIVAMGGSQSMVVFVSEEQKVYECVGLMGSLKRGPMLPTVVRQISCGLAHTICCDMNGTVYGWGDNIFGQLSTSTPPFIVDPSSSHDNPTFLPMPPMPTSRAERLNRLTPEPQILSLLKKHNIINVACTDGSSIVLTESGKLFSFGDGRLGQHASRDRIQMINPFPVAISVREEGSDDDERVTSLACGAAHGIVLTSRRVVYTWGSSSVAAGVSLPATTTHGSSGSLVITETPVPQTMKRMHLSNVVRISSSGDVCVAVLANGTVYQWTIGDEPMLVDNTQKLRVGLASRYALVTESLEDLQKYLEARKQQR